MNGAINLICHLKTRRRPRQAVDLKLFYKYLHAIFEKQSIGDSKKSITSGAESAGRC